MWHRQVTTNGAGDSVIRTWTDGDTPRFRVDIVCEAREFRKTLAEYATHDEANKVAGWFGMAGNLHAEIIPIGDPSRVCA
jgi:hypothetical protein